MRYYENIEIFVYLYEGKSNYQFARYNNASNPKHILKSLKRAHLRFLGNGEFVNELNPDILESLIFDLESLDYPTEKSQSCFNLTI